MLLLPAASFSPRSGVGSIRTVPGSADAGPVRWSLRSQLSPTDVLRDEPYTEDRPPHVADCDEDVPAGPCLGGRLEKLKAVSLPHDPRRDIDRRLRSDLTPGGRDRPGVANALLMVSMHLCPKYLLSAQKRRQVLLHSNNCTIL